MAKTTAKKTAAKKTTTPRKRIVYREPKKPVQKSAEALTNLHVYVPDPAVAERYVNRQVWGIWDGVIASIALQEGKNILLEGDTGSGKTMFGEAFAAKHQLPYYSLPCDVSIDPSAIFGKMVPTETPGKFRFQDGPLTQIFRYGGVFNASEINFMTPKISASLYQAFDSRRSISLLGHEGEVVRAHLGKGKCWCSEKNCNKKRVLIIADMNPNYRGTIELNAAFKNRFEFKIPWGYDEKVEEELVQFPTLREVAKKLRQSSDVLTPVSTNMLMEFEQFSLDSNLGLEFAQNNFMSAFEVDERQPLTNVLNLNKTNLEKDIKFITRKRKQKPSDVESDDDLEEIEFVQENVL